MARAIVSDGIVHASAIDPQARADDYVNTGPRPIVPLPLAPVSQTDGEPRGVVVLAPRRLDGFGLCDAAAPVFV